MATHGRSDGPLRVQTCRSPARAKAGASVEGGLGGNRVLGISGVSEWKALNNKPPWCVPGVWPFEGRRKI